MSDEQRPVEDWATDFDIFDPGYVKDPAPVWDELRARCPIAHTERWGGAWMATKYDDLRELVRMVPELSSRAVAVVPLPPEMREEAIAEAKKVLFQPDWKKVFEPENLLESTRRITAI